MLLVPLMHYHNNIAAIAGAGLVALCVHVSRSNSGVTETDDCVKVVSPESSKSSSPPKPSTFWASLGHAAYCNDLM